MMLAQVRMLAPDPTALGESGMVLAWRVDNITQRYAASCEEIVIPMSPRPNHHLRSARVIVNSTLLTKEKRETHSYTTFALRS